jgi:DNA invertase Pin-like site-specific DNA recombinase
MIFGLFTVLAEFEREFIIERTRAGLAAARARGRKGGRPHKIDKATLKMAMSYMRQSNSQKAREWFEKAAALGFEPSRCNLELMPK